MNEIKLIAPLAVGKLGVEPDGNKKNVLNPIVVIPELIILTVSFCVQTKQSGAPMSKATTSRRSEPENGRVPCQK